MEQLNLEKAVKVYELIGDYLTDNTESIVKLFLRLAIEVPDKLFAVLDILVGLSVEDTKKYSPIELQEIFIQTYMNNKLYLLKSFMEN